MLNNLKSKICWAHIDLQVNQQLFKPYYIRVTFINSIILIDIWTSSSSSINVQICSKYNFHFKVSVYFLIATFGFPILASLMYKTNSIKNFFIYVTFEVRFFKLWIKNKIWTQINWNVFCTPQSRLRHYNILLITDILLFWLDWSCVLTFYYILIVFWLLEVIKYLRFFLIYSYVKYNYLNCHKKEYKIELMFNKYILYKMFNIFFIENTLRWEINENYTLIEIYGKYLYQIYMKYKY